MHEEEDEEAEDEEERHACVDGDANEDSAIVVTPVVEVVQLSEAMRASPDTGCGPPKNQNSATAGAMATKPMGLTIDTRSRRRNGC